MITHIFKLKGCRMSTMSVKTSKLAEEIAMVLRWANGKASFIDLHR